MGKLYSDKIALLGGSRGETESLEVRRISVVIQPEGVAGG
jgi:hypothetical protein